VAVSFIEIGKRPTQVMIRSVARPRSCGIGDSKVGLRFHLARPRLPNRLALTLDTPREAAGSIFINFPPICAPGVAIRGDSRCLHRSI
jgi:hypothetical protein